MAIHLSTLRSHRLFRISPWLIKAFVLVIVILVLAFGIFLGFLLMARNSPLALPAPSGNYPVGRAEFDWVETSRTDQLADQGKNPRELVVWIWYPAAKSGSVLAPYLPSAWAQVRDRDQGIGVLVERDFSKIQTHSFENMPLPPAPQAFPVLLMQPGMGPMVADYTTLAENLASHGYIVVGIQPTDSSNWTMFPDGRVVRRTTRGTIPDSATPDAMNADGSRILAVWVADLKFGLDQLQKVNNDPASPFYHRLDLAHTGFWGHSFGGAAALALCQTDSHCQAGVDMDGTPWGKERQASNPHPFMFLTEDYHTSCDENCTLIHQAFENTSSGAYFISLEGTGHFNFSDLPYRQTSILRPLFMVAGYEGSIDPGRALTITNSYLVAFFDHYLKGTTEPLLRGPSSQFSEVSFERH